MNPRAVSKGRVRRPRRNAARALRRAQKPKARNHSSQSLRPKASGQIQRWRDEILRLREQLRLEREQLEDERQTLQDAERELEASRDRYVDLYDFAPVGYLTLSRSGCITDANLTAAHLLGLERNSLLNRPLLPLVAPADRRAFLRHLNRALAAESEKTTSELWFLRRDGRRLLLQLISLRSSETSPGGLRIRTALTDLTEQQRAEHARRRLAAIVEFSEDAIVGKNLDGMITSWNRGAERLFGYTAKEAIGKSILFIIPAERRAEETEILGKIRRGEAVEHYETIRRRKDGSEVPVSLTISPVKDSDGHVVGASKIARDITRRRQAEEALRGARDELERRVRERTLELTRANAALQVEVCAHQKAEEALRESEGRLHAILDNSPEMIFLKDVEGRYLVYNRRFEDAFGLRPRQAIGKTDFEIFPPAQARAFRGNDLKVLETGTPLQFEEIAVQKDGRHNSIASKFPIHDAEGKIYAVGGIVTDITERKRLEREVVRISEHEQQRIAQDLHDGLGQQLAGTWFLSDTLRKALAARSAAEVPMASKIVQLLESTVSQIRALARGLSPVPAQPDGLMAALEGLATQCSELFGVNCRFICDSPVLIRNNKIATNLYRIAQEAINNAVKHGHAREVEIGLSAIEGRPALKVTDDGIGFKGVNEREGMGLRTMNYRADVIGADFAIRKRKRRGTEVTCNLKTLDENDGERNSDQGDRGEAQTDSDRR